MPLPAGTRIGVYEVQSPLGAGGMGEVYRARDTTLGRDVAIKVLPPFASDHEGLARFEREARMLAAVNHPRIGAIYGVEHINGVPALVLEFVPGMTLAERIAQGAMRTEEAIPIAVQIADALDAAHHEGIVHRDLKPANIKITPSGSVKVLDFGLAKQQPSAHTHQEFDDYHTDAVTILGEGTRVGMILGTMPYMSPEQARGQIVDRRTDVWAFACVLFEMLTGTKAFSGQTTADYLAAILEREPQWSRLPSTVPPHVVHALRRCLEKDPARRWRDVRDVRLQLETANNGVPTPMLSRKRMRVALIAGAIVALVTVLVIVASRRPPIAPPLVLSILPPPDGFDASPDPSISPNGRYVVFKALDTSRRTVVWLKGLDSPDARPIPGTEGSDNTPPPFWSPNSDAVGFFAEGRLKRVNLDGTGLLELAVATNARGGTWGRSGVIIFNAAGEARGLSQVSEAGGQVTVVPLPVQADGLPHGTWPRFLADGRHFLYVVTGAAPAANGSYVTTIDGGTTTRVGDVMSAIHSGDYLLFVRQGALFAQPFDDQRFQLHGDPKRIADRIGFSAGGNAAFSASANGTLTYWSGSFVPRTQLTWLDRAGRRLATVGEPGFYLGFALSSDERQIVVERLNETTAQYDIWRIDPTSGGATRLASGRSAITPVFSPDGAELLTMDLGRGLVIRRIDGAAPERVISDATTRWTTDWSGDGRFVAFYESTPAADRIMTKAVKEPFGTTMYAQGPSLGFAQFSPDGRWVAYHSNEADRDQVYVDSFPTPGNKKAISVAGTLGGGYEKWRRDGRELYYLGSNGHLMAAPLDTSGAIVRASAPIELFSAPPTANQGSRTQFAPNADGSKFLFNAIVGDQRPTGITVLLNWPAMIDGR